MLFDSTLHEHPAYYPSSADLLTCRLDLPMLRQNSAIIKPTTMATVVSHLYCFILFLQIFISNVSLDRRFSDFKRCADDECSSEYFLLRELWNSKQYSWKSIQPTLSPPPYPRWAALYPTSGYRLTFDLLFSKLTWTSTTKTLKGINILCKKRTVTMLTLICNTATTSLSFAG